MTILHEDVKRSFRLYVHMLTYEYVDMCKQTSIINFPTISTYSFSENGDLYTERGLSVSRVPLVDMPQNSQTHSRLLIRENWS